jgi:hypothetical protein
MGGPPVRSSGRHSLAKPGATGGARIGPLSRAHDSSLPRVVIRLMENRTTAPKKPRSETDEMLGFYRTKWI